VFELINRNYPQWFAVFYLILLAGCVSSAKMWQADRLVNQGNYQSAIAKYREIMKAKPGTEDARAAYLKVGEVYYENLKDTEKAVGIFEKIAKTYPTSPQAGEALWFLGKHYYEEGKYKLARNKFIQLVLDFPKSGKVKAAKIQIAKCYEKMEEYKKAIDTYGEFERAYPSDSIVPKILLVKGEIYEKLEEKDKAIGEYQRLLKGFPSYYDEVAKAKERLEALDETPVEPVTSVSSEPEPPRPEPQRSRPNARAILASWEASPTFGYNPRELLMEGGLFGGSELRENLASGGERFAYAVHSMGVMYYSMQDYKRAGACLEKSVEFDDFLSRPSAKSDAYLKLGVCYKKVGVASKAKEMFKKAVEIYPDSIYNLILESESHIAQKNYDEAIALLEILLGISSDEDARIYSLISIAYRKKGDTKNAEKYNKLAQESQ